MTVIDLIIKLQQMPQNMEVMFDETKNEAEMFKFTSIDGCEEIETATGEKIISLYNGIDRYEENPN